MTTMNTLSYLAGTGTTATYPNGATLPYVGRGVYKRTLLERAQPLLIHQDFGQTKPLPLNSGESVVFRRYNRLSTTTVPLDEGVTKTGVLLTVTDYVATPDWYGNHTIVTDRVDLMHVDRVIVEASKLLGENMGESMDIVHREKLVAGTSVYCVEDDDGGTYTVGTTRGNVAGTFCRSVIDAVIRDLESNNSKTFTPRIGGADKANTYPVDEAYWSIIHPHVAHDIRRINGGFTGDNKNDWVPVEKYANYKGVKRGEIGAYRNVRFIQTTQAKIFADSGALLSGAAAGMKSTNNVNADVYACLFFGRDAYGIVPLERHSGTIMIERAGGNTDPYRQRNTVAWKACSTCVILMDEWMYRVECAALD